MQGFSVAGINLPRATGAAPRVGKILVALFLVFARLLV